jgi:hypothetical protein
MEDAVFQVEKEEGNHKNFAVKSSKAHCQDSLATTKTSHPPSNPSLLLIFS